MMTSTLVTEETLTGAPPPWQGGRVIVVDDNQASAFMLADFVRLIGHEADVLAARDEQALVAQILERDPDVVFLDIMLGQLDGRAVARQLRDSGCGAYLVAVTGWGEPDDRAFSLRSGFDEHWAKPLDTARVELFMRQRPRRVA
jgi:DNA-binding response OmpR family regulator